MSLPTVTIIGQVKFKETKVLPSGKQITSMTVSCSEKKKDGGYDNLNIKAEFWEQGSKFVDQYFQDGSPIVVTGKLITNSYESNGQKRNEIKFHFPQASFVPKQIDAQPSQPTQNNYSQPAPQERPNQGSVPPNMPQEEEIPFAPLKVV